MYQADKTNGFALESKIAVKIGLRLINQDRTESLFFTGTLGIDHGNGCHVYNFPD